jgi:hypothetical protein
MTMHRDGRSISEIRRIIDETYQAFGQPTDTPFPPSDL